MQEQKDLEMKAEIATRLLTRGHRVKVQYEDLTVACSSHTNKNHGGNEI